MELYTRIITRGHNRLGVTEFANGESHYTLISDRRPPRGFVLLAFSIDRDGRLIGDGRDAQTAKRGRTLRKNWF